MKALNILVVDDEPEICHIVATVLRPQGHKVETTSDSHEGLVQALATPESYDLIIADHNMPELAGYKMIGELRAKGFRNHVIVLSNELHYDLEKTYQNLNVDFVIKKPFTLDNIREAVSVLANLDAREKS